MSLYLFIFAVIIVTCVTLNKVSGKLGIPTLLLFLLVGVVCGSADDSFAAQRGLLVSNVSTIALIFIMFYGGFGTRWKSARPVVTEAALLATAGVALTAFFTGLFCHLVLGWTWLEGLLMGSVVSSTDAASVFSILRTRKLGLKNNTAPMIEVESGSNDPMSFMLTSVMLSMMTGPVSAGKVVWTIFSQIVFGGLGGLAIATLAVWALRRISFRNNGFDLLLYMAIAVASYAIPDMVGGNGFLSTYIVGIVLGNVEISGRKSLVAFFDAFTSLMQIIIFFLLGMLAVPSNLVVAVLPALVIFAFLSLVARPLAVFGVLGPFRRYPVNQQGFISFVGLRGAASIVFAIMTLTSGAVLQNDIFSIVFVIVLISISLQGSLIPMVASKMKMTDNSDVMSTFSDFSENSEMSFGCIHISDDSVWANRMVKDLMLPKDSLIVLVLRGKERLVPNGTTLLLPEDRVVLCTRSYQDETSDSLIHHRLSEDSRWDGVKVRDYHVADGLLVMIQRGSERIIPNGDTVLRSGDMLVLLKQNEVRI